MTYTLTLKNIYICITAALALLEFVNGPQGDCINFLLTISMALPISLVKSHKINLKANKDFKHEFINKIYTLKDSDFNKKNLLNLLLDFIEDIKLPKGQQIAVLTQLSYGTGSFITLGKRYPITITSTNLNSEKDIISYAELLDTNIRFMDHDYHELTFNRILFNYTLITGEEYNRMSQRGALNIKDISKEEPIIKDTLMGLPLNQLYKGWGSKITVIDATNFKIEGLSQGDYYIMITNDLNNENITTINIYSYSGALIKTFLDRKINSNHFIRYTEKKEFYIKDGKVYFLYQNRFSNLRNITKLSPMKDIKLNMITLDTETYVDESGNMQLYCICFFDGKESKSFYITDFNNINEMIGALFNELLRRKYASYSIYIHNASNFDLIFLLKYLVSLENARVKPLMRDGKFINTIVEYGDSLQYRLYIKDSLLLLPMSLDKLAKSFNTETQKLEFDHDAINYSNLEEAKDKAISYCIADCVSLYQVIEKFNQETYNIFKINISESPTLPALAFRIFRTNYLNKNRIPIIKDSILNDISKAYFGGHVDSYIPHF